MKKTIAWLILAAWAVVILGLLTLISFQMPLFILLLLGGFFGVIAFVWALDQLGL